MFAVENLTQKTFLGHVTQARSLKSRMIGLLAHTSLEPGTGLWISPCSSIHTFFMRFSIDVVFISSTYTILKTYEDLKPFRLSAWVTKAAGVLELPSGTLAQTRSLPSHQLSIRRVA